MALKKQERKERLTEIYRMLLISTANEQEIKIIRDKVSLLLADDTGLFILDE